MNIDGINKSYCVYKKDTINKTNAKNKTNETCMRKKDRVEFSTARPTTISALKESIILCIKSSANSDRISDLKSNIAENDYNVSASDIADVIFGYTKE